MFHFHQQQQRPQQIKGLTYIKQFITKEQQQQLIKNILSQQWNTTLKRRTQHYGYQYMYDRRNSIKLAQPIPEWAIKVKQRIQGIVQKYIMQDNKQKHQQQEILPKDKTIIFDQLIINEYTPGQGINPHIDNPALFSSPIVSLSLGSDCVMEFDKQTKQSNQTVQIPLKRRSIIILDKQARYEWKHSIPGRKKDDGKLRGVRWSLTWRIMKQGDKKDSKEDDQDKQKLGKKIKMDQ